MDQEKLLTLNISSIYRHFLIPTIFSAAAHSLYCLADVIFVAIASGSAGLAAMNIVMPIFTLYTSVALMLGVGGATTMSVCLGRGDPETANRVMTLSAVLCLGVGILASILSTVYLEELAFALGCTPELLPDVRAYLLPITSTTFMYMFSYYLQVIVRSDNDPRLVMGATVLANIFNIVFDYLLVITFGLGIFGASLATAAASFIVVGLLSLHFIRRRNQARFVRDFWHLRLLPRIMRNGFASALLEISVSVVTLLFNLTLLRLGGQLYIAAYAIIANVAFVGKSIFNGIGQAAQPIISVNYGAGQFERVRQANRLALLTAALVSAAIYAVFLLFPRAVVDLFARGDETLIAVTIPALRLYFLSFVFTAINSMLMYFFQSIERPVLSTTVSLLRGFAFVALGLAVLTPLLHIDGVWLTMTFAETLTIVLAAPLAFFTLRKLCRTPKGEAE